MRKVAFYPFADEDWTEKILKSEGFDYSKHQEDSGLTVFVVVVSSKSDLETLFQELCLADQSWWYCK